MNYFTFAALHSADKCSNEQQIFGLNKDNINKVASAATTYQQQQMAYQQQLYVNLQNSRLSQKARRLWPTVGHLKNMSHPVLTAILERNWHEFAKLVSSTKGTASGLSLFTHKKSPHPVFKDILEKNPFIHVSGIHDPTRRADNFCQTALLRQLFGLGRIWRSSAHFTSGSSWVRRPW